MDRKSFTFVASIGIVVVIVALGVYLGFTVGQNSATGEPSVAPSQDVVAGGLPTDGDHSLNAPSVCGLPLVEMDNSQPMGPVELRQDQIFYTGRMWMPKVPGVGPGVWDEDKKLASCFARTRLGVVFRGMWVWGSHWSGAEPMDIYESWYSHGQYRDEKLAGHIGDSGVGVQKPDMQFKGYRILQYDGVHAVLDLLLELSTPSGPQYWSDTAHLVWEDGDWHLDVDIPPGDRYGMVEVNSMAGYHWIGLV